MSGDELDASKVSIGCDSTSHSAEKRVEKVLPQREVGWVIALEFGLCNGRAHSRSFWEGYQLSAFSGNYPLPRSTVCPVTRGAATIQRDTMSGIKGPAFWPQLRRPLQLPPPLWDAQQLDFSPGPAHKLSASFPGPPTCNANPSGGQSGMTVHGPSPTRSGSGTLALRPQG